MNRQSQECVESLKTGPQGNNQTRLKISWFPQTGWTATPVGNIQKQSRPASKDNLMLRPAPWSGKNGKRLRILVAAADTAFNTSLRWTFALMPQVEIVGTAVNGAETLRLVGEMEPDLAVLDLYLPGIDGWQAGSVIREFYPAARIIIIGSDETDEVRNICLDRYADGFVSRRNYYQELPREISRVLFGPPGTAPMGRVSP